jgi:hypothetical protein
MTRSPETSILIQFLCSKDAQTILIVPIPIGNPTPQGRNGYQLPPPAHPFSQHGINLSKNPQRLSGTARTTRQRLHFAAPRRVRFI